MAKSVTGKLDTHTKTARPANVGPHDFQKDQHDPDKRGFTPEEGYKPRPGDTAPSPAVRGEGPANIPVKGGAGSSDDAGVTPETRAKATGRGKHGSTGGLAEE
jgi:hypothetical protein